MHQSGLRAAMFVTVLVGARDARAEQTAESCKEGFARAQHRETDGMISAAGDAYAGCAGELVIELDALLAPDERELLARPAPRFRLGAKLPPKPNDS